MVKGKHRKKSNKEEEFSIYPEEQHDTCEHRWHLAKANMAAFSYDDRLLSALFICDKCGKQKRIEGKE